MTDKAIAIFKPAWYALMVKPRHEKAVAQNLALRDLEGYLPLYRSRRQWSDRRKDVDLPLFAGYVFCRFGYSSRLSILNTPGVTGIVGFGGREAPLEEVEIANIRALLASGHPVEPWAWLRVGQRVRIEHGSLAGLTGILVREKGIYRVVLNIDILQRSIAVEVDREILQSVA